MSVWTSARDGSDKTYLGQIGRVSGLTWETTLPGGDRQASWSMRLDSSADLPELAQGRLCGVTVGAQEVWTGDLAEPQPNGPTSRQFSADGSAVEVSRYYAASDPNVWKLTGNTGSVYNAQLRGLSVIAGTLYDAPYGQASPNDGSKKLDQAVNEVADLLGMTWQVNRGVLSMFPYPTEPDFQVFARDQGSRSLNEFVTLLIVRYHNGTEPVSTSVSNGQGGTRGIREEQYDLTNNGTLTLAQATALGQIELARRGIRTRFSSPLVVGKGDIVNMGGSPVDPLTLRAGCVVSVQQLDVSRGGEPTGEPPTVLIGSVVCDYDSGTATLTPFDFTGSSLVAALAGGLTNRPGRSSF